MDNSVEYDYGFVIVGKTIKASPTKVRLLKSDPEGIRTPNPQSRNLMRYPIAPRSQFISIKKASQMRSLLG